MKLGKIRLITAIFFLALSAYAEAAQVWLEDLMVDDVSFFITPVDGYKIIQIRFESFPSTTCASANSHNVVYIPASSVFDANWQMVYSTFLSAQAQGLPVDVLINDAHCNMASGHYDFGSEPEGLGVRFYGVRLDGPLDGSN